VLFIAGKEDNAVPLQAVLQQCHLPAICYLTILPEAGHMGMMEEGDKCKEALQTFLQNI
jgi:pimeloyl-ACP methyl ester carboxylesterase